MAGWKNSLSNQARSRSINERRETRIPDEELFEADFKPLPSRTKESRLEANGVRYAVERGWMHKKIGTNAWPDHMFLRRGRTVFVEFKREGEKPRANQDRRLGQLRDNGFEAVVIDRKEQFSNVFGP